MNKFILCVVLVVVGGCGAGYDAQEVADKAAQYCAERTESITIAFDTMGVVTVSCVVPADKVLAQ